jgi:hypothetical protein
VIGASGLAWLVWPALILSAAAVVVLVALVARDIGEKTLW